MAEVIIDIGADGTVKIESKGVVGQGCGALTKAIEGALGQTTSDVKKAEYFQQAPITQKNVAGR